jgi:hypothetical protein
VAHALLHVKGEGGLMDNAENKNIPFASDKQGHYDVDGTSFADQDVIVSGDALNPNVNREADQLRREVDENKNPTMRIPAQ